MTDGSHIGLGKTYQSWSDGRRYTAQDTTRYVEVHRRSFFSLINGSSAMILNVLSDMQSTLAIFPLRQVKSGC